MPKEDRRIVFDYSEAYRAIYALCVQKEMRKPPPGTIVSMVADPDNDQKIKVKIENTQINTSAENEYNRDFLAAALMLYCRSMSIPLAKKARKSVELAENGIVLRIMI